MLFYHSLVLLRIFSLPYPHPLCLYRSDSVTRSFVSKCLCARVENVWPPKQETHNDGTRTNPNRNRGDETTTAMAATNEEKKQQQPSPSSIIGNNYLTLFTKVNYETGSRYLNDWNLHKQSAPIGNLKKMTNIQTISMQNSHWRNFF